MELQAAKKHGSPTQDGLPVSLQRTFEVRVDAVNALKRHLLSDKGLGGKADTGASGKRRVTIRCASVIEDGQYTGEFPIKGDTTRFVQRKVRELAKARQALTRNPNNKKLQTKVVAGLTGYAAELATHGLGANGGVMLGAPFGSVQFIVQWCDGQLMRLAQKVQCLICRASSRWRRRLHCCRYYDASGPCLRRSSTP